MCEKILNNKGLYNIDNNEIINECEIRKYWRQFPLPQLDTTFPFKRNPLDRHLIVREWIDWNYESSLMSRDKFNKFQGTTIFAAYFYPFCKNIERYENLVKYMIQFFVFDDHTEAEWGDVRRNINEGLKIWGQLESALDKLITKEAIPMNNWKPYVLALYSVFDSIFNQFNSVQKHRSVNAWKGYIEGNLEENEMINNGMKMISIQQMIKIRIKSIGFRPSAQFIEYADNIFIPEEDWNDPRLQQLIDLMSEIFVYVNDFFSFEKEFIQQKGNLKEMFNLVSLISRLNGIPIETALERVANMTKDMERRIKNAINDIISDPNCSPVKKIFIERMNYFIGGNHKVSTVLDRYNKFVN